MNLTLQNIHILVIEDIIPMQDLLKHMLRMLGVGEITTAKDGASGYEKYVRETPDIIMTDWQMPEMDGLELVHKIRKHKNSPNRSIPIIMMTGFCAHQRISLARDGGATEFLVKPFSANDIAKRLGHIVQNSRDFIVTPEFIGPDRRRKKNDGYRGENNRKSETNKKIKATDVLVQKTGVGALDQILIDKSQNVLDNNKINFIPIVENFLAQLNEAIHKAKQEEEPTRKALDDMVDPIMQIKANARVLKYTLVGNLADIMLTFLERLNLADQYAFEIIQAHQNTLTHLVSREMKGSGGDTGAALEKELQSACNRYMNIKSKIHEGKLKKVKAKE
ncbi:MAG: hypothetical protein COB14_02090 [Alphaproteobacteria bacterium]|nr:MAG: hypothetical protein COB14_02090 [Alphaproteobacteria bacterium]